MQCLVSVILATLEVEIRRIATQGQPQFKKKKVHKTPSQPIAVHAGAFLSSQQRRKA
jgi:hypothetical protein